MAWLKFDLATIDKPEVLEMAEVLGTSSDDVIGKLLRVWGWFDQQSRDGNAGGVTGNALKRFIDRLVGSQGFAASMAKVGWLTDSGIPNFDTHNGESSKKRALTNNRVKRSRNDDSVTKALPEKIREEVNTNTASITPISKPTKQRGTSLPAGFVLSKRVLDWGAGKGYTDAALVEHFENFILQAAAKDYQYANWDSALINAIRNDWAKVGLGSRDGKRLSL